MIELDKIKVRNRHKLGRPAKQYSYNQINHAIKSTESMKMASEYMNISYETFKKWAKIHNLWAPLKSNKGIKRRHSTKISPFGLQKILEGENPSPYRETVLLKKCFQEGYLEQACSTCGQDFSFIQDNKWPLVLDFMDKNHLNTKLDNLRVLCLNCVYHLQTTIKGWYRHRDIPLNQVIDNQLPRDINITPTPSSSNTLSDDLSNALTSSDTLAPPPSEDIEVEYIAFEEFQKTLDN